MAKELKQQRNKTAFACSSFIQDKMWIWIYSKRTFHHCSLHSKQSLFTSGNTLSPKRGDEKWPWEDGSGPGGVKGEKARHGCAEAQCLLLRRSRADRGHLQRLFTLHQSAEKKRQGLSGVPGSYRAPTCCTSHPKHLQSVLQKLAALPRASRLIGNAWPIPVSSTQTSAEFST